MLDLLIDRGRIGGRFCIESGFYFDDFCRIGGFSVVGFDSFGFDSFNVGGFGVGFDSFGVVDAGSFNGFVRRLFPFDNLFRHIEVRRLRCVFGFGVFGFEGWFFAFYGVFRRVVDFSVFGFGAGRRFFEDLIGFVVDECGGQGGLGLSQPFFYILGRFGYFEFGRGLGLLRQGEGVEERFERSVEFAL